MPRDYQQSIRGRTLEAQTPDAINYQPTAQVVDQYVAPAKTNSALQLADALSSFNQRLSPLVEQKYKEEVEKQNQQGMLGYLKGDSPDNQSESWKDGYMALKWEDYGRQAQVRLAEQFEQNKHDPNYDPITAIRGQINEDLKGIQEDPRAIDAYLKQVMPLTEQLPIAYQKYQKALVDQETDRMLSARVSDMMNVYGKMSPQEFRTIYDNEIPTWEAMGKTKNDLAASMVDQMVAYAEENLDPSVFSFAYEKGADGIALADLKGVEQKLADAQNRVEAAQKKKILEETMPERAERWGNWQTLLRTDPHSKELDLENLSNHVGPYGLFNTDKELGTFWGQVLDARMKGQEGTAYDEWLLVNTGLWRFESEKPEFKEWYNAATDNILKTEILPFANDPAKMKAGIGKLIQYQQWSGVAPRELSGLFGQINTASVDGFMGKVPADLMMAMQLAAVVDDMGNPDLLRTWTTDDSASLIRQVQRRLGSRPLTEEALADAIVAVKQSRTASNAEQNKLILDNKEWQADVLKETESEFNGWEATIGGWFGGQGTAGNVNIIQTYVMGEVRSLVLENGMGIDDAKAEAIERAKRKFSTDGGGNFVEIPKEHLGNKEVISKGLGLVSDEFRKRYGEENKYTPFLAKDGKTYGFRDQASGQVLYVPVDQVLATASPVGYGQGQQLHQNVALVAKIKQNVAKGSLGPIRKELEDNYDSVIRILSSNELSWLERLKVRQHLKLRMAVEADRVKKEVGESLKLINKGNVLADPAKLSTMLPQGRNPNTPSNVAELAKYYYKADPAAALVMMAEGISMTAKPDSNGAMAIGFGYNFAGRDAQTVKKDLQKAGIPTADIAGVIEGKKPINMEQAIKLFQISRKPYEDIARRSYGDGYDKLAPHVKAVVFDMAYNAGSPSKFKEVLSLFKDGKFEEASKKLTLKYWDKDKKQYVNNKTRIQYWREMLSGKFETVLDMHVKKKGK